MKNKYITACNTCKQSKMKAEMIQQAEGYKCIPCNKKKYEIMLFDWRETDDMIEQLLLANERREYIYETTKLWGNDSRSFVISENKMTQTQANNVTQKMIDSLLI